MSSQREPVFNLPPVITALLLLMGAIFFVMVLLPEEMGSFLLLDWSFIPARFAAGLGLDPLAALQTASGQKLSAEDAVIIQFLTEEDTMRPWTLLSYALLHGSGLHLFLNGVWLAAFGSPLARRVGAERFLLLFGLCAIGGGLTHFALNWYDVSPLVGASAGIAGCMAAAALFMFQPGAGLSGLSFGRPSAHQPPALSLREAFRDQRVMWFLGTWLAINLLTGLFNPVPGGSDHIAWEAHIGGFIVGLALFPLLDPVGRSR
ncbi:MAG: rhomboid family intramembrane serine protease [Beijerinckiaceae bacterium]